FHDKVRHFNWKIIFRPRTLLYMGVWTLVGIALLVALLTRDRLELNVLHDRNPQYVLESDGSIRNGYTLRVLNMIPEPRNIVLTIEGLPGATMKINGITDQQVRTVNFLAEPDEANTLKVFVTLPGDQVAWSSESFYFVATDAEHAETDRYKAVFNGPGVKK